MVTLETLRENIAPISAAVSALALLVCAIYARKQNRTAAALRLQLQTALDDAQRGWNQAAVHRLEVQQRDEAAAARWSSRVLPPPPPTFVPGTIAAMQTVMDEAVKEHGQPPSPHQRTLRVIDDRNATLENVGVGGGGDVTIIDPRPDEAMVAEAQRDKLAHINQGRPIDRALTAHPQTPQEAASRILTFEDRQRGLTAQIEEEARQEAIAALSEEKRVELLAEGGEPALLAYVEPVVVETMALLAKQTGRMTAAMVNGNEDRNDEFETMMRRGFGFEPRPAIPELRTILTQKPVDNRPEPPVNP